MSSEALEKKLVGVESLTGLEEYTKIDVYGIGTTVLYSFDPPKPFKPLFDEPFDLQGKWEPPSEYGIGGPGEARTIFPGLVARERVDLTEHDGSEVHNNIDYFSIFNGSKPILPDPKIHYKDWKK